MCPCTPAEGPQYLELTLANGGYGAISRSLSSMKLQEIGVNLYAKQRSTNDAVVHTKHGVKAPSANLYDVSDESFSCGEERRLVHLHLD
jgi:hypothetical protein